MPDCRCRSTGDTISTLNKTFARQDLSLDGLGQLRQALDLFIERHSDPDDAPSSRVQEELRRICNDNLGTEPSKLEGFILALTVLEPYLRTTGDLQAWFELVVSTMIDAQGTKKTLIQQTQDFVLACTDYDKDGPDVQERAKSCQTFISKLVQELLKRTAALADGTVTTTLRSQNRAQQQLQAIALQVGRAHPKKLFLALEEPLIAPTSRFHALQFICAWLKQQQPHLDVIANTSVFDIMLKCLMNDRSTVMISVALQCLLMLLPHIPATVASQLPRLFLIYSRCLCWEKFSSSSSKAQKDLVTDDRIRAGSDDEADQLFSIDPDWKVVSSVPDAPEAPAPELLCYFTYLYGLYPLNFTSYIRKPRKYLKQIDFPGAEDFDLDQAVIRSRTEQFQSAHLLHPSFFNMTAEEELTDNRWLKAEPSEVVAECLGLYSGRQPAMASLPGPPPSGDLPALPSSPSLSKRPTPMSPDRLLSPASESIPASPSSASLAPSMTDSLPSKSSQPVSRDVIYLQRELLVMRNELNFERHLKQQHAAAIGQLKRERIKAVTVEAETATLINANRSLLRKLTEATKFNEKLQKETQSRKAHARQSEDQLNAKLRSLRSALADQEGLETSLKKAHDDIEVLRQLVVESESREVKAKEKSESQDAELKHMEGLRAELAMLKREAQSFEGRETDLKAEMDLLRRDLEMNRAMVTSHDQERERSKKAFQIKIADLESQLAAIGLNGDKSDEDATIRELEEARAKCASIQRAWIKANREVQELRIRYDDLLRAVGNRMSSGPGSSIPDDNDAYMWRGPPVGGTYKAPDGAHSQPIHMDGGSFPTNRPFRAEALDDRADSYGILSRSEGSSGAHGVVARESNMISGGTGILPGTARSYGAPGHEPSMFQLGSNGSGDHKMYR
ncbi:hypothetical protein K461DRAFT_226713 [Myriangium duriaei CBS 260.36]|uniref:Tuberous sclerosis 1 n=1 Tax=Myriangium duriaei CBS 260.36 TaxID=1168546 RepID=A0A9P4J551_9PEZI|nr:hypothetical protein K461DRAFT_226713 [Myriangium duriaei CBS 260.36]